MKLISLVALGLFSTQAFSQQLLSNITSWGYQLENFCTNTPQEQIWDWEVETAPYKDKEGNFVNLKNDCLAPQDALVKMQGASNSIFIIDPSNTYIDDSTGETGIKANIDWTTEQLSTIKAGGNVLLAYISIGQANEVKYYFKSLPNNILGAKDKEYAGAFDVNFADATWVSIFVQDTATFGTSMVKRLIDQGFDGVFLDRVDTFYQDKDKPEVKVKKAQAMASLVRQISQAGKAYANTLGRNFYVAVQNATMLSKPGDFLANPKTEMYDAIDIQVVESMVFDGAASPKVRSDKELNNSDQYSIASNVRRIVSDYNKMVLNIEYIYQPGVSSYATNKDTYKKKMSSFFAAQEAKIFPLFSSPENTRALIGKYEMQTK